MKKQEIIDQVEEAELTVTDLAEVEIGLVGKEEEVAEEDDVFSSTPNVEIPLLPFAYHIIR